MGAIIGRFWGKVTLGMSRLPITKEEYSKGRGFSEPCMIIIIIDAIR